MSRAILLLFLSSFLAFGQAFTFNDLPFVSQGITDWSRRVVANGGAMPSANTIAAMETLRTTLISMNLTSKIHSLCIFVPDSVIAATTPLIKHKGADPWTNSGFVIGDLTISGLKGDGTSKFLDTAVKAKDGEAVGLEENCGLSVIVTEGTTNQASVVIGYWDPDGTSDGLELEVSASGISAWIGGALSGGNTRVITNDWDRVGFVHGARNTNDVLSLYVASPLETHKLFGTVTTAVDPTFTTDNTLPVFVRRRGATNSTDTFSSARLSMVCIDTGMNATESSNLWWAVKTCRESLGGGTGDQIHDYNRKIVDAGASAISTTTSNALRIYYAGLDADGLLYTMVAVNPLVPDSLTAARTPLIWQAGAQFWTNVAFGSTNLSSSGLAGNTTSKYFGTAITPSVVASSATHGFGTTSAGLTAVLFSNSGNDNTLMGELPNAASVDFRLQKEPTRLIYRCWRNDLNGTNSVFWALPATNWIGYISGNRTAANVLKMYVASSIQTHTNVVSSGSGNQTGTAAANSTNMLAFAHNNNGTPGNFTDSTLSYLAIHSGHTETQSSNHYVRVNALRVALGGGAP